MSRVVVFDEAGGPDVLRIVDEPAAEPGAGEVRVKIEAVGVNRLDTLVRGGASPRPFPLPYARIGCEGTGVVDALGAGVDGFEVGDPVVITAVPEMHRNGTYADYTVVSAGAIVPRPERLDVAEAAAFWVSYSTAYGALVEKAKTRPGDHVLINAASGGVGLAAIQVARQLGAIPLAVTRDSAKKEFLLSAGAEAVVATDREEVGEATKRLTNGVGAEIVIDPVMGPGLAALGGAAKFGGTLVALGWLDPRPAPFPRTWPLTMYGFMGFELLLDGETVHRTAAFLSAGVRIGALRPAVDKVFAFDEIAAAHEYLEKGSPAGKVVVTV